jgi:hypothetical protein
VSQGLGFAAAGALGQILPAHQAITLGGAPGLAAVLALGRTGTRAGRVAVIAPKHSPAAAAHD